MTLSTGAYLAGVVQIAAIAVAALLCGARLRERMLPELTGVPAHLATVVVAVGLVTLVAVALGSAGLLSSGPLVAGMLALAIGIRLGVAPTERGAVAGGEGEWRLATGSLMAGRTWARRIAIGGCFAIAAIVPARFGLATAGSYGSGMTGFDSTWYHGTFAAMMAGSGSTLELNQIAPQYLSWFYPNGSELLHAIGMLAFERDLLSPGLNLVVMLGCMAACWSLGRPFGLAPLTLAAGSIVLGSGLLADQAGEARNDLLGIFFTLAGAAILINVRARSGVGSAVQGAGVRAGASGPELTCGAFVVIGLAAGLAAGVKLNYLATAVGLVGATIFLAPAGRRTLAGLTLVGAALAGGGYWYLRNLVHSGNPLPWINSIGPIELPGPEQEIGGREQHGVIEYVLDFGTWVEWFGPGLRETLTLLWPLVLLGALVSVVVLLRRPGAERAIGVMILATVAGWLVAPASAEGPEGEPVGFVSGLRYLAPALVLAWALLPVAVVHLIGNARAGTGAGPVPAPARRPPRWALWASVVIATVALLAGGDRLQRHYLENRYADPDFATPGLQAAFVWARDRSETAIATTATRQYPLLGTDLSNRVEFVGLERPAGGYVRPTDCRQWRQALNRIGPEYVLVAWDRYEPGRPPLPPAAGWTAASPAAGEVLREPGAVVYRVAGPLSLATCP